MHMHFFKIALKIIKIMLSDKKVWFFFTFTLKLLGSGWPWRTIRNISRNFQEVLWRFGWDMKITKKIAKLCVCFHSLYMCACMCLSKNIQKAIRRPNLTYEDSADIWGFEEKVIHKRTDKWTDKGTDNRTDKGTDKGTNKRTDKGMDKQTDKGTVKRTDNRTDGPVPNYYKEFHEVM